MSLSDIPGWLRELVLARDGDRCQYCRMLQRGQGAAFHIDHVWPSSRGGRTEAGNLALQCPHCSGRKAAKVDATDPGTGRSVSLFHPLDQRWSEHFELRPDGACVGLTPVGRATVEALAMNRRLPQEARAAQIGLGWLEVFTGDE